MILSKEQQTLMLLAQLSQELKALTLWQSCRPSLKQMASTAPFHYDTLTLEQWLQFVFIRRMAVLIELGADLPASCAIAPMAEESFRGMKLANEKALLNVILHMDQLLTR